jgi:hypothetical protein
MWSSPVSTTSAVTASPDDEDRDVVAQPSPLQGVDVGEQPVDDRFAGGVL